MGKMVIRRRPGASGKLRNQEMLLISLTDSQGNSLASEANACTWEDFLFHLSPVTPRAVLHQGDRELRREGIATMTVNDSVIDEAWIKSFLLTEE